MSRSQDQTATKRQARSERRRNQTRTEILDVARAQVLKNGLVEFSLATVAEELGLTKPALYYYFVSKESLMFELVLTEWFDSGQKVHDAVEATETGADAIEVLMRTSFEHYRSRLDLFRLVFMAPPAGTFGRYIGPEELSRIRPVNALYYGGAEARIRADQKKRRFSTKHDPRRFPFLAHMAVNGVLNMKAMVEYADDPLVHRDEDLIDDLCRTFRDSAQYQGPR
jgi:AcrR family transcriptional regulator